MQKLHAAHLIHVVPSSTCRCDTVTDAVMMQYSRDFKGHLASLFLNDNINLGKKYVFDIRRTSKEVYDHARRALYHSGVSDLSPRPAGGVRSASSPGRGEDDGPDCGSCRQSRALQERLQKLREALLCMLCCEEEIDAAFCPCGHMVCCQSCANQLEVREPPTRLYRTARTSSLKKGRK